MQGARWLTGIDVGNAVDGDDIDKAANKKPLLRKGPFKKLGSGGRI